MEAIANVRKLKLRIAVVFGGALLSVGFFTWRAHRWDQPWLAPMKGDDLVAIRFEGLGHEDKDFSQFKNAFLRTTPDLYGFKPCDMSSDDRRWPTRYSWVQMIGYVESSQRDEALRKMTKDVDAEIRKTGLSVKWRMALIARDGSVIYPD